MWRDIRGRRGSGIRPVREENPGLPPELRLGGRVRREGFWHVRRMGGLMFHHWRGGFPGGCQHVHDRVVSAGADVQDGRAGTGPPQRLFDRPGHVGNVGEVAALAAVAVDDERLARLDAATERFQGKIGPLPRSPDREKPKRHEAQAVEPGVKAAPLLAVEFGQGVGAARVGWGRFLGRQRSFRPIDAGRRGEHEVGDAHAAAEFQQADGADDVGDFVFERAVHRRAHTGQRGKVDHGVEGPVGQFPLADVANMERHALWQRILWRDVVEAGDAVPCRMQVPDNVGAYETR